MNVELAFNAIAKELHRKSLTAADCIGEGRGANCKTRDSFNIKQYVDDEKEKVSCCWWTRANQFQSPKNLQVSSRPPALFRSEVQYVNRHTAFQIIWVYKWDRAESWFFCVALSLAQSALTNLNNFLCLFYDSLRWSVCRFLITVFPFKMLKVRTLTRLNAIADQYLFGGCNGCLLALYDNKGSLCVAL